MATIRPDSSYASPVDSFSLLRAVSNKADGSNSFDDHLQRLAAEPKRNDPAPSTPDSVTRSASSQRGDRRDEESQKRSSDESGQDANAGAPQTPSATNKAEPAPPPVAVAAATTTAKAPAASATAPTPAPKAHTKTDTRSRGGKHQPSGAKQGGDKQPAAGAAKTQTATGTAAAAKPAQVTQSQTTQQSADKPVVTAAEAADKSAAVDKPAAAAAAVDAVKVAVQPQVTAAKGKAGTDPKAAAANSRTNGVDPRATGANPAAAAADAQAKAAQPAVAPQTTDPQAAYQPVRNFNSDATADDKKSAHTIKKGQAATEGPAAPTSPDAGTATAAVTAASAIVETTIKDAAAPTIDATAPKAPDTPAPPSATPDASAAAQATGGNTTKTSSTSSTGGMSPTNGGTSNLSDVDRVRFVQRVSRAMQTAGDGDGSLKLRLSPPELGAVRVEVTVKDGVMSARLEAETPAARQALLDSAGELQGRLAEHNIQLDRFEVELADHGGSGSGAAGDRWTGDTGSGQNSGSSTPRPKTQFTAQGNAPATATPRSVVGSDQLNVVI